MVDQAQLLGLAEEQHSEEALRAAIYARTSVQSRDYGYSINQQVEYGVKRCDQLGWEVRFVYRDEAESGKDTERPMFQSMLKAAQNELFDVIVFWKLDRFSRSLMHAVQLESELREYDVSLHSLTEQIDTTSAAGRFNFRNIASAAEFERDLTRQRTKVGMEGLAKEHRWPNNEPPFGYRLTDENRLQIVEEEAALVKRIFERYIELRSMPEVAAELNDLGITTRQGNEWTPATIGNILRNQIYTGQYEVANVAEYVEEYQIIEQDVYDTVTEIRMRFQSEGVSRSPMDDERKQAAIDHIISEYQDYLDID